MKPLHQWEPWKAMVVAFSAGCVFAIVTITSITFALLTIRKFL